MPVETSAKLMYTLRECLRYAAYANYVLYNFYLPDPQRYYSCRLVVAVDEEEEED